MIIVAHNQTASDLLLKQLSAVDGKIPASGSSTLTDYNTKTEILEDSQLLSYIDDDKTLLEVNGVLLTKEQSLSITEDAPALKSNLSASADPTVNDDDSQGYSIGSLWINTVGERIFFCIDDSTGAASWVTAASEPGITEAEHQVLRQLIHFIDDGPAKGFLSGAYKETLPSGNPFPTSEIWWESSSKLKKILELITTWTGPFVTQETWKVYDTDGSTVLQTVTDTVSYSGAFETSRTRTIS